MIIRALLAIATLVLSSSLLVTCTSGGDGDGGGENGGGGNADGGGATADGGGGAADASGGNAAGTFGAECDVGCREEAARDGCEVPPNCVDDCVAMTENLDTLCGKCVANATRTIAHSNGICTVEAGTVNSCSSACLGGSHGVSLDFRAECDAECREEATIDGCDVPPNCVDDCVIVTSGLATLCGKCVADTTRTIAHSDGICTVELGSVSSCSDYCGI